MNIASNIAAYLSDSDESSRIPIKKKARTSVMRSNKGLQKKAHKHHGNQRYCMICKKAGMPERKYMLYSAKDCTVQRTNQTIKDGMGGSMGSRADTAKQYNKYEKKCNKELKAINNQNKLFYGISKNSGSHREIKNI